MAQTQMKRKYNLSLTKQGIPSTSGEKKIKIQVKRNGPGQYIAKNSFKESNNINIISEVAVQPTKVLPQYTETEDSVLYSMLYKPTSENYGLITTVADIHNEDNLVVDNITSHIQSVLVGAPKSNSTYVNHTSLKEPGVLYKCEIGNNDPCRPFVIDPEGNTENRPGDSRFNYKSKRDGGMLGAALDGGSNVGDPVFVCSPKWANDRFDKNGQHYLVNGLCYFLQNSINLNAVGQKIMPLLNAGKQGYFLGVIKYYYANGQAGTSMHYLNKGQQTELLLGAPGVLSWKGTTIRYKSLSSHISPPQQRLTELRDKRQAYNEVNIPNPVFISNLMEEDNTYFGYAISSGNFHSRYPEILWYVAGAPRAEELFGLVLLYEFPTFDDADLVVHKKLIGHQFGSYFGAALLCIDINGDSADDILIGAPTYFIDSWDEGCVHVYKNNGEGNFESHLNLFGDKKTGARFGTAISNLGDINGDLYKDIAIAAPNEDGHGAVYIYLGSKNGLSSEYNQKIAARNIDISLHGFGFSLSKGLDIDHNLSNGTLHYLFSSNKVFLDLAIGAYLSGHVAILKSRPVVKYTAYLTSNMEELAVNIDTFNVTYCISYNSSTDSVDFVDIKIQLTKDSRALNTSSFERDVTLTRSNNFCASMPIILKKSETMDFSKPFTIEFFYSTIEQTKQEFCSKCPVTDPLDSKSVSLKIPFANGCGNDNICQPDLKITAKFENNVETFTLGTISTLKLHVHVENNGEPAYLVKVMMQLPADLEIVRISNKCELGENRMCQCLLDNVLQSNTNKVLTFEFDVKNLDPKQPKLFLNLTTESKGEEINFIDNNFIINMPLQSLCDINIAGKSVPDQIVYMNESQIKFDVFNFTHEFFIENIGPSPLWNYSIDFYFPIRPIKSTMILFDIYKPEVYANNQPMNCSTNEGVDFFRDDTFGKDIGIEQFSLGSSTRRLKRNTDNPENDVLSGLPVDRIFFINCSNSHIECIHVTCFNDEILVRNQHITANFHIRAHVDNLNKMLTTEDIILLSSNTEINKNAEAIKSYSIRTVFLGSLPEKTISYWIYFVCIAAAFVILMAIVFVLYKLNFFNRPTREKLQNEYENSSTVREINDDDHEDDDEEESEENVHSRL